MVEKQPLPEFSHQSETQSNLNPYYQAVIENQWMWREAKRGLMRPHEMPKLSANVEAKMKHIFSGYINPTFPRVLIASSLVLDTPKEEVTYHALVNRSPETIQGADIVSHRTGMYHLNEWATNYATMHYLEKASTNPLTKPVRQAYAVYGDALVGRFMARYAYQAMDKVRKTAQVAGANFDHAVFQGLFRHDFSQLDTLIAQTDALEAASLDELAIAVGKHSAKVFDPTLTQYRHLTSTPSDSPIVKALKNTADSFLTGGRFAKPGIVEVVLTAPLTMAIVGGAVEGAFGGDLRTVVTTASMVGGMTVTTTPFLIIHEAVHGYSASADHVGLTTRQLVQAERRG